MNILYINAAFRKDSRTKRIADGYLSKCKGNITIIDLGKEDISPLNKETLEIYNESVVLNKYEHPMFDYAKQFAEAEEIIIASPFWNYSIPAILHNYLELVCTQGITFDISGEGKYYSKCKAKKLTYITTAGGYIPKNDHAFGYLKSLAGIFWNITDIQYIKAEGMDVVGVDVEKIIRDINNTEELA